MTVPFHFTRSHALGNDYLVCDPAALPVELTPARARLICDRHLGVGSDGILVLSQAVGGADAGLRIFNPDGSEAEKSGNGLRIFAKWLYDTGRIPKEQFVVHTPSGPVPLSVEVVERRARWVTADMGTPAIRPELTRLDLDGEQLDVVALSMGNPHCVVLRESLSLEELRRLGPRIEQHAEFPSRTNVQFARAVSRDRVEALIWERGAGETQASGSSACAVVAALHGRGLVGSEVTVSMPGGELAITIRDGGHLWMRGPAEEIAQVALSPELIERLIALGSE